MTPFDFGLYILLGVIALIAIFTVKELAGM